LWNILLAWNC